MLNQLWSQPREVESAEETAVSPEKQPRLSMNTRTASLIADSHMYLGSKMRRGP